MNRTKFEEILNKYKVMKEEIVKRESCKSYQELQQKSRELEIKENKNQFKEQILKESKGTLESAEIDKLIENVIDENGNLPGIICTSDPKAFDESALEKYIEGEEESHTDVLEGDYQSGIISVDYSKMSVTKEMSDFSMDKRQVALKKFNSRYFDKYYDGRCLVIYEPEDKEFGYKTSYKNMLIEERQSALKKAIEEKLKRKNNRGGIK